MLGLGFGTPFGSAAKFVLGHKFWFGTAVVDVQSKDVRSSLQTAVSAATAEQPDSES